MQATTFDGYEQMPQALWEDLEDCSDYSESSVEEEEFRVGEDDYQRPKLSPMSNPTQALEDVAKLHTFTERYNLWTAVLGDRARSSKPWARAAGAVKMRNEIDELLEELHNKMTKFEVQMSSFQIGTSAWHHPQFFTQIEDLTDFEPAEVNAMLWGDRQMQVEHAEVWPLGDFAEYLEEMLPRVAMKAGYSRGPEVFFENVKWLIGNFRADIQSDDADPEDEYRLWVVAKAQVFRGDSPRLQNADVLRSAHELANTNLRELLDYKEQRGFFNHWANYWGFASTFRILHSAWNNPQIDDTGLDWKDYYRRSSYHLMRNLQEQAIVEIRGNTRQALMLAPCSLPVELEDMIFEATLRAEGVPLSLTVDVPEDAVPF